MTRRHPAIAAALAALALASFSSGLRAQETLTQRIQWILSEVPLIDGHNDLPSQIRSVKTSEGDVGLYDLRLGTQTSLGSGGHGRRPVLVRAGQRRSPAAGDVAARHRPPHDRRVSG